MESELLSGVKTVTLKLGDKEFELSEINLNTMIAIEEEFDCSIAELKDKFQKRQASTLRSLAYVMIKDKAPDVTKESIGKLVTVQNLQEVAEKLFMVINNSLGEK